MRGFPTIYENIIFIEAPVPEAQQVAPIKVDLSFKFGAQLKSLRDVKQGLVSHAVKLGCNCVAEFKYGQKSRWLAIDDVAHFGNGVAVVLPPEKYNEILEYIQNRDN